jgi:hypothetical protein
MQINKKSLIVPIIGLIFFFSIIHFSLAETFSIECKQDSDCRDKYGGGICDLTNVNFGKCIQTPEPQCGDGTCQPSETKSGCPQDCDVDFKLRQQRGAFDSRMNTIIGIAGIIIVALVILIIYLIKRKR